MGPKNVLLLAVGDHLSGIQAVDPAIVADGAWRFTAVTDRLIRIEYDVEQAFVDEPTDAFVRSPPSGKWVTAVEHTDNWATIQTASVTVRYIPGTAPSDGTVVVSNKDGFEYKWGDDPAIGNLGGTARTMDDNAETLDLNCHHKVSPTMENSQEHCVWGLVSRAGWAIVNQTGMPIWKDDWYAPSRNSIDMFVFLHGLDFAGAMKDFARAAGAPAVPPRYALGTIFTRWFNFDSDSVMNLVERFEEHTFPLDAWIFDMNWHQYGPWGSFTWNSDSYPNRQELLTWMRDKGLPIGANTHDHDGIRKGEATYDAFCKALGHAQCTEDIPFDLYNKTYAMAQEDIAWGSLATKPGRQGLDFAWIDYQQGEDDHFEGTTIPNLNPTIVMNRLRSTNAARHGENSRGMIVSRWGGYGNHRYPVGFSGDQLHSWKGLAYLPYFTSTAANVGFGYWSHDVVGGGGDWGPGVADTARDYELSVRWVQTAAWSPVLRFHDKGQGTGDCATTDHCARIVPWKLPEQFYEAVREAVWQREELLPYMYTAAVKAATTGLTLTRPMYYFDPADDKLYDLKQQYLFGDDMIVSPISAPSGSNTSDAFEQALGAVKWSVYAPAGAGWVDRVNGDFGTNQTLTNVYGINDVPGLVREGAVIPMKPKSRTGHVLARAQEPLSAVEFRIMPAKAFYSTGSVQMSAEGFVVDDDGMTTEYMQGKQSNTTCSYRFNGTTFAVKIRQTGDFSGKPWATTVVLSFPQMPPLQLATPASRHWYDHDLLGSVFTFRDVTLHEQDLDIVINLDPQYEHVRANFIGVLGHLRQARYVKDALDVVNIKYGDNRANLTQYVLAATQMTPAIAETLPSLWSDAVNQIATLLDTDKTLKADARRSKFIAQMMNLEEHASAAIDLVV